MRIGVFCSGGDAPGMNACVRAVVRTAVAAGHEVIGICDGYSGLLERRLHKDGEGGCTMGLRTVSGWTKLGGTLLKTSRCEAFRTDSGQIEAARILRDLRIDALIPIGGDGTFRGAMALARHWNGQIVGCPGTIDNDLCGTDATIGFSTAVQTAVEAVDKIRDTAESHRRMFLIEVMGRHSGFIAVHTAIAAGAEIVCIPELDRTPDALLEQLAELERRGKTSVMAVIAEGDQFGGAQKLDELLQARSCPFSTRVAVLGHLQRGGAPNVEDRILASHLGAGAVAAILRGKTGVMAGRRDDTCVLTPFEETVASHKPIPRKLLELINTMAN